MNIVQKKTKTSESKDKEKQIETKEEKKESKEKEVKENKDSKESKEEKKESKQESHSLSLDSGDSKEDTIILLSQEKKEYKIQRKAALQSQMIKTALEDDKDAKEVNLVHISGPIVQKVVDYMTYHIDREPRKIESPLKSTNMKELVDRYDAAFVDDIDQDTLFKLLLAANYMDVKSLLGLICAKVASMMKGKTADQIRKTFNIRGEFTPEEEEEIRKEHKDLLVE